MAVLDIVEIGRKQAYIFASNRLKEIEGASMIIRHVSERLPKELSLPYFGKNNVIMEGGGHSIYQFNTRHEGYEFNRMLSRTVLKQFPGLQFYCVMVDFNPEADLLSDKITELSEALAQKKSGHAGSLRQYSYGIEKLCESTRLPATEIVTIKDEVRFVSAEIYAKLKFAQDNKLEEYFADLQLSGLPVQMTSDTDVLEDGERSKVAVIHLDGNRMGEKIAKFRELYQIKEGESVRDYNQRYREAFRQFSNDIDTKYKAAFKAAMVDLYSRVQVSDEPIALNTYNENGIPVRPIIFAGDDISFIVPGPLGVEAARMMLEKLQQDKLEIDGGPGSRKVSMTLHACAGVAIVKSGYPFARAHEMAEQLCRMAKTRVLQDGFERLEEGDASALDFHILHGDWSGSIRQQREEDYLMKDANNQAYSLTLKPYYVMSPSARQSVSGLFNQLATFQVAWERMTDKEKIARSKIKKLRECIKRGPAETKRFIQLNQLEDYLMGFKDTPLEQGEIFTYERCCPYYDAIEAMDDVLLFPREEREL
ncbi:hypothetical protein [Desulforamulus ruminis]|uniref:hypothetical protein n=1 Tax=Desulforamulus ruminis TaxID=1564 RepID=UPI00031FA6BB